MTLQKATSQDMINLQKAASQVYLSIKAGEDPENAVVKTAQDQGYNSNWVQRLCEVTNRLLVVDHIENAPEEKRAAGHPLVDPQEVIDKMFPAQLTAKAASARIVMPLARPCRTTSEFVKAASTALNSDVLEVDPKGLLDRAEKYIRQMKTAAQCARDEINWITDKIGHLSKNASRLIMDEELDFSEVEKRAVAYFGDDARYAMSIIGRHFQDHEPLEGRPPVYTTTNWDKSAATRAVREMVIETRRAALDINDNISREKVASKIEGALKAGLKNISDQEKKAGAGTSAFLRYMASPMTKEDPEPEKATEQDLMLAGLDPEDIALMNSVRARQALLAALSDPVIARSDLNSVVDAYNRISSIAPRAVMNEGALPVLLRQALEQPDQSVHDLTQVETMEQGLASQADPMRAS